MVAAAAAAVVVVVMIVVIEVVIVEAVDGWTFSVHTTKGFKNKTKNCASQRFSTRWKSKEEYVVVVQERRSLEY
jgi:hypothetical protein